MPRYRYTAAHSAIITGLAHGVDKVKVLEPRPGDAPVPPEGASIEFLPGDLLWSARRIEHPFLQRTDDQPGIPDPDEVDEPDDQPAPAETDEPAQEA